VRKTFAHACLAPFLPWALELLIFAWAFVD
jgi:hypothetical protein